MAFVLHPDRAHAADVAQQRLVKPHAEREDDHAAEQRRDDRTDPHAEQGAEAHRRKQEQRRVHAGDEQLAVREVDHPHDAEDQRQADAHQPVERADGEPRREGAQRVFDQDGERAQAAARLIRSTRPACFSRWSPTRVVSASVIRIRIPIRALRRARWKPLIANCDMLWYVIASAGRSPYRWVV